MINSRASSLTAVSLRVKRLGFNKFHGTTCYCGRFWTVLRGRWYHAFFILNWAHNDKLSKTGENLLGIRGGLFQRGGVGGALWRVGVHISFSGTWARSFPRTTTCCRFSEKLSGIKRSSVLFAPLADAHSRLKKGGFGFFPVNSLADDLNTKNR